MQITERTAGDIERLLAAARREKDAEQKDRWLCVVHACRGVETADIQTMLARSRGFVQRWVYAYRDGGVEALK
jgi:transposase